MSTEKVEKGLILIEGSGRGNSLSAGLVVGYR